jgi:hypothetical protein
MSNRKTNNATLSEQFQCPIEKQIMPQWHYLFFYWTLELFRHCGIICFSIGHWNCSDSVALFVFLLDFGTVPTVWHYLFFYWTLELFRQCGMSNRKTNNATLSEQFQSPIGKQIMPHCRNSSKVQQKSK